MSHDLTLCLNLANRMFVHAFEKDMVAFEYVRCVLLSSSLCRLKHAQDMVVNLGFEKERLSNLVQEEADQMKRLNDILAIVEM